MTGSARQADAGVEQAVAPLIAESELMSLPDSTTFESASGGLPSTDSTLLSNCSALHTSSTGGDVIAAGNPFESSVVVPPNTAYIDIDHARFFFAHISSSCRGIFSPRVQPSISATARMNRAASATPRLVEPARVFARLPTVMQATGLGRSTIYRLVASGGFPPPVHLGPRAVAWRWSDHRSMGRFTSSRFALIVDLCAALRVQGGRSPAPANP